MIEALPLSPEAFAPFGAVARNGEGDLKPIRDGSVLLTKTRARCIHDEEALDFAIDFYEVAPETDRLHMTRAEKHPHSAQIFMAFNAERYLVVVWSGEPGPANEPHAFLARGTDVVIYNPGIWHHGIVALDRPTLFTSAMWKTTSGSDTVFNELGAPQEVIWP